MSLLRSLCLAGLLLGGLTVHAIDLDPSTSLIGGFRVGCQAYTFNRFTAFEAIDKTAQAGGKLIEFYLWQPLSPQMTNVLVDENLSEEHIRLLKEKLKQSGVTAVSGYVRGTNFAKYGTDEAKFRKVFEFAKKMGFESLTGEPPVAAFDIIEKLCKEFDVKFCLHNHRREDANPAYTYWDPKQTLELMKKRDKRMGICLDTGHLVRSGLDPVQALQLQKERVHSLHLKDPIGVTEAGHDTVFGKGIGKPKEVLRELKKQGFTGYVSIEYENNWDNSVPDVKQCVDFIRKEGDALDKEMLAEGVKAVALPKGFKYEILAHGDIPEPVDLEFAPDGRLWFTGRRGHVWAMDLKTREKVVVAHLTTPWEQIPGKENNERGLHGIEFHPEFTKNGFVYLYYSVGGPGAYSNRVSRFTANTPARATSLDPKSEKVLIEFVSSRGYHQGGAMEYNPKDGKLYISTGDNNVSPETKTFYNDPNNPPQVLGDLRGKTLRINLDGSIPQDNPFVKTAGARPEVFTYGHRNPYSMNLDFETGNVYVGEVGYDRPEDFEEINWLKAGGNYGWPRCIGTNVGTFGGECPIPNAVQPFVQYIHERGGANATSGPFYRKNTGEHAFPAPWQNGMFYGDYSRKWIRFAQVDPSNNVATNTVPFARGFGGPLSIQPGPDGGIYFVEYGGWFTPSPKDRVSRIIYVGDKPEVAAAGN